MVYVRKDPYHDSYVICDTVNLSLKFTEDARMAEWYRDIMSGKLPMPVL